LRQLGAGIVAVGAQACAFQSEAEWKSLNIDFAHAGSASLLKAFPNSAKLDEARLFQPICLSTARADHDAIMVRHLLSVLAPAEFG
jgi:hypothetical protein